MLSHARISATVTCGPFTSFLKIKAISGSIFAWIKGEMEIGSPSNNCILSSKNPIGWLMNTHHFLFCFTC